MSVTPFPTAFPHSSALGDTIRLVWTNVTGHQPDSEPSWRAHVAGLISPLRDAFAHHCAVTEGDGGLYAELVSDAPRLAHAVDGLVEEHAHLCSAMAHLAGITAARGADAALIRQRTMAVLDDLTKHQQRDSDLVHEAYGTDIGGE